MLIALNSESLADGDDDLTIDIFGTAAAGEVVQGDRQALKHRAVSLCVGKTLNQFVSDVSGIEIGDNLLSFGESKASAKIKIALPYVDQVRIGIKLPDTVNIVITEIDVVYAIQDVDGIWWLMTSEGRIMEQTDAFMLAGTNPKAYTHSAYYPNAKYFQIANTDITCEVGWIKRKDYSPSALALEFSQILSSYYA